MDIDLVYLWVNGNDPKWQAKRDACIGRPTERQENCKGRYADSGELKYSLRSIEMYAPWIRKIFIVTDDQEPEWLNTENPKIQVVDHKEIMPAESLALLQLDIDRALSRQDTRLIGAFPLLQRRHVYKPAHHSGYILRSRRTAYTVYEPQTFPKAGAMV